MKHILPQDQVQLPHADRDYYVLHPDSINHKTNSILDPFLQHTDKVTKGAKIVDSHCRLPASKMALSLLETRNLSFIGVLKA